MKTSLIIFFAGIISLSATKPAITIKTMKEIRMSNPGTNGSTPRFTTDHRGNPVLSWVEKEGEKATFYFAVSSDGGQTFGTRVKVDAPANISVHAEGMPKLAVKADGTILAIFEVSQPTPESRFAADLLYVTSTDGGTTWTVPQSIHHGASLNENQPLANRRPANRSFGDLTRLPNGEIGVVWLDDKLPGNEGRSVRFVATQPGGGFGPEILIDENACQCCRTNVFVDAKNQVHLTYRDVLADGARDISHVVSTDVGQPFTKPQVIVADGWKVNACPHTGPVLAQVGTDVFATWFSGKEGTIGLRLAKLGQPKLVSALYSDRAKHPQVVNSADQLIWIWDESVRKEKTGEDDFPYVQKIALRVLNGSANAPTAYLTPESVNASYPVALATKNGLLVAYEQRQGQDNAAIMCQWVSIH